MVLPPSTSAPPGECILTWALLIDTPPLHQRITVMQEAEQELKQVKESLEDTPLVGNLVACARTQDQVLYRHTMTPPCVSVFGAMTDLTCSPTMVNTFSP